MAATTSRSIAKCQIYQKISNFYFQNDNFSRKTYFFSTRFFLKFNYTFQRIAPKRFQHDSENLKSPLDLNTFFWTNVTWPVEIESHLVKCSDLDVFEMIVDDDHLKSTDVKMGRVADARQRPEWCRRLQLSVTG